MGIFTVNGHTVLRECRFCGKLIGSPCHKRHEDWCFKNPKNYKECKYCGIQIKSGKFCCKSHAASFNGSRRKHSKETKKKIAMGVVDNLQKKNPLKIYKIDPKEYYCIKCNIKLDLNRMYCDTCRKIVRKEYALQRVDILNLSYLKSELPIKEKIESIIGPVKKEKIGRKFVDFTNDNYLIEYTADPTRGAMEAIDRLNSITDDDRIKILITHISGIGPIRRKRCNNINILDISKFNEGVWIKGE